MRRLLILFAALAVCVSVKAQIYDGITQPTKYRLWLSITQPTEGSGSVVVSPFVGYKYAATEWFSVTPVLQYNFTTSAFSPQVWLNFNVRQRLYILSRSIYDGATNEYRHTLSATVKLPLNFMVDATWENLFNGRRFVDGDRMQILAGFADKWVVVNAGYSFRAHRGFIANIRFKVTDYNWLQLKYDGGIRAATVGVALQFN